MFLDNFIGLNWYLISSENMPHINKQMPQKHKCIINDMMIQLLSTITNSLALNEF